MKYEARGEIYECDACGDRVLAEEVGTLPDGYHGTIEHVMNEKRVVDRQDWYACRKSHIANALKNTLEGVRGGNDSPVL